MKERNECDTKEEKKIKTQKGQRETNIGFNV